MLCRVKNLILEWLEGEVRVLYLAQGEYKKTWWVSKPRNPTGKNCAYSIVRVAAAASITRKDFSQWISQKSPNFPLLQDAQVFFSPEKI